MLVKPTNLSWRKKKAKGGLKAYMQPDTCKKKDMAKSGLFVGHRLWSQVEMSLSIFLREG